MKKLVEDPWKHINEKYQIGQVVKGKVLKVNPFGLFVELDQDIHGLAHISELSDKPVSDTTTIAKPGDEMEFMIVSIKPEQHRLGLSLKALKQKGKVQVEEAQQETTKEPEQKQSPTNKLLFFTRSTKTGKYQPQEEVAF